MALFPKLKVIKGQIPCSELTSYEGLNMANRKSQKLVVFGRKLEGSHSLFYCYFENNIKENEIIMFN